MPHTYTLTIPLATIKAALLHAGKKDIRFYLNGLAIDLTAPAAPVVVATDGHHLLAVDLVAHAGRPAAVDVRQSGAMPDNTVPIIPREALDKLKLPRGGTAVTITLSADDPADGEPLQRYTHATISAAGAETRVRLIEGCYPDWRRVMPPLNDAVRMPAHAGDFDPEYLSDGASAAVHLGLSSVKFPGLPQDMARYAQAPDMLRVLTYPHPETLDPVERTPREVAECIDEALQGLPLTMPWVQGVRMIIVSRRR